jgi:hypothetical protein
LLSATLIITDGFVVFGFSYKLNYIMRHSWLSLPPGNECGNAIDHHHQRCT